MVTTPTVWKAQYQLNFTAAGHQFDPDVIDIGMGRYLAVWTELAGGPIGTSNGSDIVGQIFDAEGVRVGSEFQINQNFFVNNEEDAALATRPGGGFVMVYEVASTSDFKRVAIASDTYDADGHRITSGVPIAIAPDPGTATLASPAIAMRSDGSYLVTYQSKVSASNTDIVGRTVSAKGTVSNAFTIVDDGDNTVDPEAAVLTNGNYVVVYQDEFFGDDTDHDIRFSIVTPAGGLVIDRYFLSTTTADDTQPDVAALAGGGFVGVWRQENGDGSLTGIEARIVDNAGNPKTVFAVNTTTAGTQAEPKVTALPDGGFVVVWADYEARLLRGQRFNATGTKVGSEFITGDLDFEANPVVTTLGDGRVITGFRDLFSVDVYGTIFDPREKIINGTSHDDVITSRIDGATVNGLGGADTLLGQGANDTLNGGDGNDTLDGGAGADQMRGGTGNDTYVVDNAGDTVIENANEGIDTVKASVAYTLGDNLEKLVLTGSAAINGTGNGLANTLVGNTGKNKLDGGDGADILSGGPGRDKLIGKAGKDIFVFADELSKANADKVVKFKHGKDTLFLAQDKFAAVGVKVGKKEYFEGAKAHDKNDHIIRDGKRLFYDPDGNGGTKQMLFAKVDKKAVINHHDFEVGDFVI